MKRNYVIIITRNLRYIVSQSFKVEDAVKPVFKKLCICIIEELHESCRLLTDLVHSFLFRSRVISNFIRRLLNFV